MSSRKYKLLCLDFPGNTEIRSEWVISDPDSPGLSESELCLEFFAPGKEGFCFFSWYASFLGKVIPLIGFCFSPK